MNGKYQVCKRNYGEPDSCYQVVGCFDTWEWAKRTAGALNLCENYEFGVFVGDREIRTLKEAMAV